MLWLAECPFFWDQGLVRPLVTESKKLVLLCDSCGAVWCGPEELDSENYTDPEPPEWNTHCGVHVRPGTTRWAERSDVAESPWAHLEWHVLE